MKGSKLLEQARAAEGEVGRRRSTRGEFHVTDVAVRAKVARECEEACALAKLRVELDAEYAPPTAADPDAKDGPTSLPDQCDVASVRFPLERVPADRASASLWTLVVYLLALLRWRWLTRRG